MEKQKSCYFVISSDQNKRIAIDLEKAPVGLKNLRKDLRKLGHQQMAGDELIQMIHRVDTHAPIRNILKNLLKWIYLNYMKLEFEDQSIPLGICLFLRCIGSESPVSSYLPPTLRNMILIDEILNGTIRQRGKCMDEVQQNLPIFFNMLKDLNNELPVEGCFPKAI